MNTTKDEVGSETWPEDAERCRLAGEVYDKVFDYSESFYENNLGADLAHLLGAILDNDPPGTDRSWVDWADGCEPTLELFRKIFPPDHDVWRFIET
jgi:hypothetical protein